MLVTTSYFDGLRGKIFKILPLKESENAYLHKHLEALFRKLTGAYDVFEDIGSIPEYNDIVTIVGYMVDHEITVDECRSDMFEMQSLLDRIIARLDGDGDD